ncbi:MAG: toll/interleukin-1 receptor domain-containing protein [Candidatus Omnitrophica bacterium]|nr:toll/interleukin-1 receptor domain-containing protein [Candidatus Omnitrophota bacterium]
MLKIFLSYSKHDKKIAGQLKKYFEEHNIIQCFVAHDDIPPGSQSEQEMLKELESSDFFMPLQTINLEASYWCQQEAGFALARKIQIVPLIPDVDGSDPVGFYAKIQGAKIKLGDLRGSIKSWLISEGIITDTSEELEKRMLIFEKSASFSEAGINTRSLFELKTKFTKVDIRKIVESTLNNGQILESWDAREYLRAFFIKQNKLISKEELERFLGAG